MRYPKLFTPVSLFSVVFFRVAFGGAVLWKVVDYLVQGRVVQYWIKPTFHFKYSLFPWVAPLPGSGMLYLFYGMGVLALLVMLGLFYRPAVALLGLASAYTFLLEEAHYLNHEYLVILLCFVMTLIPASRAFSLDALLFKRGRGDTLPAWCLWLLRFHVGLPYFFGGVAKLNLDWLQGEPMRTWLARRTDFPVVGELFTREWAVHLASYGGLLLDLLAVPLLLYSRTRPYMFAGLVLFHFTNARWFTIGIFPWLMIAATTLFFPPDWPRTLWEDVKNKPVKLALVAIGGLLTASAGVWFYAYPAPPVIAAGFIAGALLAWSFMTPVPRERVSEARAQTAPQASSVRRRWVTSILTVWVAIHILLPLRHWLIPGNPNWTEEGHRFAWHMLLRDKDGTLSYLVTDPATGQRAEVDPGDILPRWQAVRLESNPHMIHQFARYIAQKFAEDGFEGVQVRAIAESSLHKREPQFLIDPTVDLASEPTVYWHAEWIEPLKQERLLADKK